MLWYRTGYRVGGGVSFYILQRINLPRAPCPRICRTFCRVAARCVAFVFVPGAVRGSRRIVVWYSVMVCCVLSRSRRCGVSPGGVPCGLLSFTVLLHSICSRWYSRRLPDRGDPVPLWWQLFPGSRSVAPAAPVLSFQRSRYWNRKAPARSVAFRCLLAFFPTTIVLHYSGVLVRFLFKYQCYGGVSEKRLKIFVKTC